MGIFDASTDLWRILKVWIDIINTSPKMVEGTEFLIITTSIAPQNSATYYLKNDEKRNINDAYQQLKEVCKKSKNKAHATYYKAFMETDEKIATKLIGHRLDLNKVTVMVDKSERPVPLKQLGSGSNWVGVHLITYFALHYFCICAKIFISGSAISDPFSI